MQKVKRIPFYMVITFCDITLSQIRFYDRAL